MHDKSLFWSKAKFDTP